MGLVEADWPIEPALAFDLLESSARISVSAINSRHVQLVQTHHNGRNTYAAVMRR